MRRKRSMAHLAQDIKGESRLAITTQENADVGVCISNTRLRESIFLLVAAYSQPALERPTY